MLRGDVVWVNFEPANPSEANKRGPSIIVSNDRANMKATMLGRGVVTVVPLTSNVEKVYAFQVLIPAGASGLGVDSKAQAEQIRSVSLTRIGETLGRVAPATLRDLDEAIRLHLDV